MGINNEYISKWLTILDEMNYANTYKLAWGRAIIEICSELKFEQDNEYEITITFEQIGEKMLKYYWNQIFYFDLKQSPSKSNKGEPRVVQYTKKLLESYKSKHNTSKPEWFNKVYPSGSKELNKEFKVALQRDIPTILAIDAVSYTHLTLPTILLV